MKEGGSDYGSVPNFTEPSSCDPAGFSEPLPNCHGRASDRPPLLRTLSARIRTRIVRGNSRFLWVA